MKKIAKRAIARATGLLGGALRDGAAAERQSLLAGKMAARQIHRLDRLDSLADAEFGIFSQWGEDGIIEWLVSQLGPMPQTFVEFGVEDYRESNTRFLLQNRNWRGLVIDGSNRHIATIRADAISWRHDLTAVSAFITTDNIDAIIRDAGFAGELGLLSIDIDGNDYWVWDAIDGVRPHIVIAEYNASFGDLLPLSVPYRPDFMRGRADSSNLYFGASCRALEELARRRGYVLVGGNSAGGNMFFVRAEAAPALLEQIRTTALRPSRFRESRDPDGRLSFISGAARAEAIAQRPVVDVVSGRQGPLASFGPLFSDEWHRMMAGLA